jgi:hypothetical protein
VAEDNLGDRALLQEAFEVAGIQADLRFVKNGDECHTWLHEFVGAGLPCLPSKVDLLYQARTATIDFGAMRLTLER